MLQLGHDFRSQAECSLRQGRPRRTRHRNGHGDSHDEVTAELGPKPCPQQMFTLGPESVPTKSSNPRPQKAFTLSWSRHPVHKMHLQLNPKPCPHNAFALGPETAPTTIALARMPHKRAGGKPHHGTRDAAGDLAVTAELPATADLAATAGSAATAAQQM
jgi:hypothetical protein